MKLFGQFVPGVDSWLTFSLMKTQEEINIGASRILVGGEDKLLQKGVLRHLKSVWIGIDVFNLFDISNVNSYYWVTDITNAQYAVPNYLTRRQINLRLSIDF